MSHASKHGVGPWFFVGFDPPVPDARVVEDPLLRQAVLDLFLANRAFVEAFERGAAIEPAVQRVDDARERVWTVQALRGALD
jgi:hypothetical protein